ncbi:MAG: septum formation family protein [Microthrixaceae bacterium]
MHRGRFDSSTTPRRHRRAALALLVAIAPVAGGACDDDGSSRPPAPSGTIKAACDGNGPESSDTTAPIILDLPGTRLADLPKADAAEALAFAAGLAERAGAGATAIRTASDGDAADRRAASTQLSVEAANLAAAVEAEAPAPAIVHAIRLRALSVDLARALDEPACATAFGFAPTEPPPPTEPVVALRECFDEPGLLGDPVKWATGTGHDLSPVDCADEHDLQTIARFEYPAGSSVPYPGDVPIAAFFTAECGDRLNSILGVPYGTSALTVVGTFPDAAAWDSGSRKMECHVIAIKASKLDEPI